jgi:type I restriction enzyme R subunit
MENDYASQDKWQSYAQNNDRKTFMMLFKKDFPNVAAKRYEMNEEFFVKMFSDPEMMSMVMDSVGGVLYERLKKKTVYTMPERTWSMVAESPVEYGKK